MTQSTSAVSSLPESDSLCPPLPIPCPSPSVDAQAFPGSLQGIPAVGEGSRTITQRGPWGPQSHLLSTSTVEKKSPGHMPKVTQEVSGRVGAFLGMRGSLTHPNFTRSRREQDTPGTKVPGRPCPALISNPQRSASWGRHVFPFP